MLREWQYTYKKRMHKSNKTHNDRIFTKAFGKYWCKYIINVYNC